MKYLYVNIVLFLCLFFSININTIKAKELQTLRIGNETIYYTETYEDIENAISYYNEDILVLTAYDDDKNTNADSWVFYREDLSVRKEMQDTDGDGTPDTFYEFDQKENITNSRGNNLEKYKIEEKTNNTINTEEEIDYAGDLTDIKKLAGESSNFSPLIIVLIILSVGAIYYWHKKKK